FWEHHPEDPAIINQYKIWVKKYPQNFIVPFAAGKMLTDWENPEATSFLLQAIALKPDHAETWSLLAMNATIQGNNKANEYLQKAALYAPKNPKYIFDYAYSLKDTDPEKYDSLSIDIARKFPDNEVGVKALYWLAAKSKIAPEKIAYYKQIFKRKANNKSSWYVGAMEEYFDLLLKTDPGQAYELGTSIILDNNLFLDLWHERLVVADAFLKSRMLLMQGKPNEALAILNKLQLRNVLLGRYIDADEYLVTFKVEALDSAKLFKAAYDTLAVHYSKAPTENLQPLIYKYGKKLKMDSMAIDKSIISKRTESAVAATDFSLRNYTDSSKSTLKDYRGKVVLVTYWFPGCGPCRAEFPHFEAVLKKFNQKEIAYLALNVEPFQDKAVLPLIKANGYSFTALRDDRKRIKGNLDDKDTEPTNFLIDQKGRIIFSRFRIEAENEKTLELMIKETLAAKD
ncbi:MAG: redoxin domain-containing protein, partial [Sphingobacteriaceae bacterium]